VTAFAPIGFWTRTGSAWARRYVGAARALAGAAAPVLPLVAGSLVGRVALGGLFFGRPWLADGDDLLADAAALVAAPGFDAAAAAFDAHRFRADDLGALSEIPVTLVWGTRDLVLPFAAQGARARRALPAARRVVLPGAGHLPFLDAPEACAALLLGRAL
jgi:pimeloyl-ACP methyl ester carboxylesterase